MLPLDIRRMICRFKSLWRTSKQGQSDRCRSGRRLAYIPDCLIEDIRREYGATLEGAANAMLHFNFGLIDALCDIVPAIKPQAAYYELLGPAGAHVLQSTIRYAQDKGMYVIADIKRNDIGATASAYAEAYLGRSGYGGRSFRFMTANPQPSMHTSAPMALSRS